MQTNMKSMTDCGLIQEQIKDLPNRASAPPMNSTAKTSGGTHELLVHRLSFSPLSKGLTKTLQ